MEKIFRRTLLCLLAVSMLAVSGNIYAENSEENNYNDIIMLEILKEHKSKFIKLTIDDTDGVFDIQQPYITRKFIKTSPNF